MKYHHTHSTYTQGGYVNPLVISNVVVGVLAIVFAGVMVWALVGYNDQKTNVDAKVDAAVNDAKRQQADEDEAKFNEKEKTPTREFVGPADLGEVRFQYPKAWSVYVARDGSSNNNAFEAYLHPEVVAPVDNQRPYALRVTIDDKDYDAVIKDYQRSVEKGDLRSSPVTANGFSGNRFDGTFTKERKGSAVVFKINDKTLVVASDADTFKTDFDGTVLKSLSFRP